jgi:predicted RNase H-like HicB family nuclease
MSEYDYPIFVSALTEEEGGGFLAVAPDLRGCMADGPTEEAAIADIRTAIAEWIDEALRLKRAVPKPGSFARRAHEKKAEIDHLIKAQDALIKTQEELLKSQREEIERIRQGVSHLIGHGARDERSYLVWAAEVSAPAPVGGQLTRQRQNRVPH